METIAPEIAKKLLNRDFANLAQRVQRGGKLLAEVMEREFRLAVKQGEYVLLEDVKTRWAYQIGQATTLLRKRLENELPPVLSGLDAIGIRKELSRAIDEFAALLHEGQ